MFKCRIHVKLNCTNTCSCWICSYILTLSTSQDLILTSFQIPGNYSARIWKTKYYKMTPINSSSSWGLTSKIEAPVINYPKPHLFHTFNWYCSRYLISSHLFQTIVAIGCQKNLATCWRTNHCILPGKRFSQC